MAEDRSEKLLEKAQKTWEDTLSYITVLPEPDEFGMVKLRYQDLRKICNQRNRLGWARGVFQTFATVSLDK